MNIDDMILTFGSNEAGIHGAGAAKYALEERGALWGQGYGMAGTTFAIPTKDRRIERLKKEKIKLYVSLFMDFADKHPEHVFQVTQIGCGLAGFKPIEIAPLFYGAPLNCQFDRAWDHLLGGTYTYWGHFE